MFQAYTSVTSSYLLSSICVNLCQPVCLDHGVVRASLGQKLSRVLCNVRWGNWELVGARADVTLSVHNK